MKKWQLGICITCAAVIAGMVIFSTVAQAAGLNGAETSVRVFDVQQVVPNHLWQQPTVHNLLATVDAERRDQAARLIREAAAALKQGAISFELQVHEVRGKRTAALVGSLAD